MTTLVSILKLIAEFIFLPLEYWFKNIFTSYASTKTFDAGVLDETHKVTSIVTAILALILSIITYYEAPLVAIVITIISTHTTLAAMYYDSNNHRNESIPIMLYFGIAYFCWFFEVFLLIGLIMRVL